ncbi:hypothetical protein [Herbaspirillum sp.]|jgi:hypothetical protein|uniref:hypothetical protein n=1 Tax=Herbaspirillum TaxID=963 RepID=UPI002589F8A2|nr:hypothetical protein [Herbaspirillum sp.]MCP3657473.1 hypothetical protein [Herbaspirillum sp.]MCP3949645.1 hypothetical protein [Herbaspirillum sp.]MCP4034896.1 hypothetical protein [Herbaspirillum sp.]MCP4556375.1 hypothetical protein [Herbaspirillum sp.]
MPALTMVDQYRGNPEQYDNDPDSERRPLLMDTPDDQIKRRKVRHRKNQQDWPNGKNNDEGVAGTSLCILISLGRPKRRSQVQVEPDTNEIDDGPPR